MIFSSIPFLYYFLPCVLLIYFAVPKGLKNAVLLVSSLFFYAWGEPRNIFFMIIAILQGYVFGILIETYPGWRAKVFLGASVTFSLCLLGYCKYANFLVENFNAVTGLSVVMPHIALPIGISFYTFQLLSYVADVYRGDAKAQRNLIHLGTYIAMFPQLIAGPIVRYSDIAEQLEHRVHSMEDAADGIRRFLIGLSKKILIANTLGEFVSVFKDSDEKSVLFFWLYAAAYMLHVYFDFSGYSDMAIGLGRIFGFRFPENFRYPFISGSITEFWRRWHISLGTWFRDYFYIPLGGNRGSKPGWLLRILLVWMATGLWHGASWNFVLWGLFFALILIAEKLCLHKLLKKTKVFGHIYVLFFALVSFVIFDTVDVSELLPTFGAMFGLTKLAGISFETVYYMKSYALILLIAAIGSTPVPAMCVSRLRKTGYGNVLVNAAEPLVLLLLLAVCTAYLVDGSFNPFLYFRF